MPMLYDAFGREIRPREVRRPLTREISAVSIRDRWSSYPSSGLTPQRLAAIFREADAGDVLRQAELFEEMEEKDAHLASQFQIRKLAVQGLDWEILPADESRRAKRAAQLCREVLEDLEDLDEHILDLLDALPKGYSVMEILWDVSEGEARPRTLRWIHPKKVTFVNSMTPRILTEEEPVRGVDPPPFKTIYHRYKARSGYDTRAGILRVCAWMYLFKNYGIKDWVAFAEVYGMPLRLGKYEPGASPEDKDALINAVRSLGTDAAGIISKNTEIDFVEAQRSTTLNVYESLTAFCDAQMSKAILGQTLTSEAGGKRGEGSYALGRVHAEVRQDLIEADCKALRRTLTRQLLAPIVGFNMGWEVPTPRFRFLYEPPEDLKEAAEIYKILHVDLGFPMSVEHISERFKVPALKEGETPLPPPGTPAGPLAGKRTAELASLHARQRDGGQTAVDSLADELLRRGEAVDPLLRPVLELVMSSASYEQILEGLYGLYPDLDTSRMEELIRQATFAADLWGYVRAKEEHGAPPMAGSLEQRANSLAPDAGGH